MKPLDFLNIFLLWNFDLSDGVLQKETRTIYSLSLSNYL